MRVEKPYNPLDKKNLGVSVVDALLSRGIDALPPGEQFSGAGIYAIYYKGEYPAYKLLAERNRAQDGNIPIYVGKAIPPGARKGGFGLDTAPGMALYNRLRQHAESIRCADNLRVEDFFCRYLAVDDIWIPLGENLLIETFSPIWNKVIDGFGNHDPGAGRYEGECPAWDVLHPGRPWASRCRTSSKSEAELIRLVQTSLTGSPP